MSSDGNSNGDSDILYECRKCNCIVGNAAQRDEHKAYHRRMNELPERTRLGVQAQKITLEIPIPGQSSVVSLTIHASVRQTGTVSARPRSSFWRNPRNPPRRTYEDNRTISGRQLETRRASRLSDRARSGHRGITIPSGRTTSRRGIPPASVGRTARRGRSFVRGSTRGTDNPTPSRSRPVTRSQTRQQKHL